MVERLANTLVGNTLEAKVIEGDRMIGIFQQIGAPELIIILLIVLLLFGASRLPEIARSLGKSSREFKKGMREGEAEEGSPAEERKTSGAGSE
jgi:TatA/E family protein of Tat protein translocase